jgi:preprotein translocase subunit SecA
MLSKMFKKIVGSRNDRLVKNYTQIAKKIGELEPSLQGLSDEALRAKTAEFKQRYSNG